MQQEIASAIDNQLITKTGMDVGYKLPLEQLLDLSAHDPLAQEHFKKTYDTNRICGYQLPADLESKVLNHYSAFLDCVPDVPKISIVQIISSTDEWKIHIDNVKTCSVFCLIKNSNPARTTWWEPKKEFEHTVRDQSNAWNNKKQSPVFRHRCITKAAMWADVGEAVLFDNNSIHSIDELNPGGDRYILTIGFVNISHDQLVYCYNQWANAL